MDRTSTECRHTGRRDAVRDSQVNGIDYLDVLDAPHPDLRVHLFRPAHDLHAGNVVIAGGRRIRDIVVTKVWPDPAMPNAVRVRVDKAGDFSQYTLRLVEAHEGRPTSRPLKGFDRRYASVDFSFKVGCPSDLDCAGDPACPPEPRDEPEISYLAKDYDTFRRLILDRLALIMPEWRERHVPDIGLTLVELLAYVGDHLSYHQDAVATEAYLDTARLRVSVRRHARLVDYLLHEGCNARAWLTIGVSQDMIEPPVMASDLYFTTGTRDAPGDVFEPLLDDPDAPIRLYAEHGTMHFYTWGDLECCLPKGATSATLRDGWVIPPPPTPTTPPPSYGPAATKKASGAYNPPTVEAKPVRKLKHLQRGDYLVFEEVKSPLTGSVDDRDPSRRHVVRLTEVAFDEDPLFKDETDPAHSFETTPVVDIRWAQEDALPFSFCLSARRPAPDCDLLTDICVAHGNVILVDHGLTIDGEDLGQVGCKTIVGACECDGSVVDTTSIPDRFEPGLKQSPLTYAEPLRPRASAFAATHRRDVRRAVPRVSVIGLPGTCPGATPASGGPADPKNPAWRWQVRGDLLHSGSRDQHVVVEIDNEGLAHLRFGDGELGRQPDAGSTFSATYRVGSGLSGNVGADTILNLVWRGKTVSGVDLVPRNPLPAIGGIAPESMDDTRLFAPHAFKTDIQRAITADDYARLAEREHASELQRAGASLKWNGSWYEASVAIDPRATDAPSRRLLRGVEASLYPFRRMGHDLDVREAVYVPLEVVLDICVLPHYLRGDVEAALLEALSAGTRRDGGRGFFHPDNLTFGQGIFLSRLIAVAQSIAGVESARVTTLRRFGEADNREIENGILPLGPLEIAQLDNDPDFPEHGTLTLKMAGGR